MNRLRPFYVYDGVATLESCDTSLLLAGKYIYIVVYCLMVRPC